ncbi:YdcF family protein [Thalassospira lucentensis]|uniref:YdcF family protein n=1 Tax=Thalassospira lucentensis TaxID=168935 RepID=UPI00142D7794|nr:YdcF family protein [Thalassospira lucentensis]NIZ00323.1 YdcF family protein [Thalassospira lucentensis]
MNKPPLSVQHKRRFRRFRFLLSTLIMIGLAWLAGFVWYVNSIPTTVDNTDQKTDAIVVLTGGSERLSEGRRLLARGLAKKLFISGVYRGVEVDELLSVGKSDPRLISCCVVLGHVAENTRGNALETAVWVYEQGYTSLRIVTANYHMRRSLLEFKSLMPDVDMIANPVFPDNVKIDSWWRYPGSAALIASEYNKYLFASLRNSVLDLLPESNRLALNIRSDTEVNAQDDATSNGIPRIGG